MSRYLGPLLLILTFAVGSVIPFFLDLTPEAGAPMEASTDQRSDSSRNEGNAPQKALPDESKQGRNLVCVPEEGWINEIERQISRLEYERLQLDLEISRLPKRRTNIRWRKLEKCTKLERKLRIIDMRLHVLRTERDITPIVDYGIIRPVLREVCEER